ncbi:hypothetical protein DFH08DRAFT_703882, partial [Mycena albidolilacea]
GIAGLACAYTLGRSGHRVRVLERTDGSQACGCPPNMTKVLVEWSLEDELKRCRACRKTTFIRGAAGQEDVLQEAGGQFLLVSVCIKSSTAYRLVLSVGAVIIFNTPVTGVEETTPTPSVHLADGTALTADLIIGADGGKSVLREFVLEQKDAGTDGGHTFYTVMIPRERMTDADLAIWAEAPQWSIGLGDNRCAFGEPGNAYSLLVIWPDTDVPAAGDVPEGWGVSCPPSTVDLSAYDERIRRVFNMVSTIQRAKYVPRNHVEDWVDRSGRVLFVGDAAHSTIVRTNTAHPTSTPAHSIIHICICRPHSMAIEDAEALGVLMARLARAEKIPQLTEGVWELRQARCAFVHAGGLSNMVFSMLRCYTILSLRATSRAVLERYRGSCGTVQYRNTAARPPNLTVQGQFRWNVGTKLKVCHEYRPDFGAAKM